jgi:pimeloyl-ACP methyl ester carboxylesterase
MGTTRVDFAALTTGLTEFYDVLAVDLPGHGGSPPLFGPHSVAALADAVEADLDSRGLGRIHIVGNSLGGRIALELARRGRARSVTALAPSGMGLPFERMYQASIMAGARIALRALAPALPAVARHPAGRTALLAPMRARPWASSEREALGLKAGFGEARRFWDTLWRTVVADVPAGLSDIDCPVTLVQGVLDAIAPGQAARYLLAVPGAHLELVTFAGHAPQADRPEAILRIVRATTSRAAGERATG